MVKRRKVWVNMYDDGEHYAYSRKAECKDATAEAAYAREIPFIEARPGDVVRTKDEEVTLVSAVDRYTEAWETAYASHTDEARRAVTECGRSLRALLRGGR